MGGKIKISAVLEVVTGMHIGGSSEYSPIGAVDSPVISDPRTGQPVIPGSSLKGKMRTLLVRSIDGDTKNSTTKTRRKCCAFSARARR